MDRVAEGPAPSQPAGARRGPRRTGQRGALPEVAAVDRRHAVAPCEGGGWTGVAPGRLRLHGGRRQRRRLGEPLVVPARRLGGCAARRLQRRRAEVGNAGLPVGPGGRRRLRVAPREGAPHGSALRRLSGRSPGRLLPDLHVPRRRLPGPLHPGRTGRAARAGRGGALDSRPGRRDNRRRGSRHRAGLRPRVAPAPERSRLQGVSLGAPLGDEGAAVPRAVRLPGGVGGDVRDSRHRDERRVVGRPGRGRARGRPGDARRGEAGSPPGRTGRRVHARTPRPAARGAVRVRVRLPAAAHPGRVRLARSDQHSGRPRAAELDLAPSVAGGCGWPPSRRRRGAQRRCEDGARSTGGGAPRSA